MFWAGRSTRVETCMNGLRCDRSAVTRCSSSALEDPGWVPWFLGNYKVDSCFSYVDGVLVIST
jgi:hypothetical protein